MSPLFVIESLERFVSKRTSIACASRESRQHHEHRESSPGARWTWIHWRSVAASWPQGGKTALSRWLTRGGGSIADRGWRARRRRQCRYSATMANVVADHDLILNLAASRCGQMEAPLDDLDGNCRASLGVLDAIRRHNPDKARLRRLAASVAGHQRYP
jgi:hypothetical protein